MSKKIIAYDLGTGGNKASLYDIDGTCLASAFVPYDTYYPKSGWHEQRPLDWWNAIIEGTHKLLDTRLIEKKDIESLAISGHSLGAVPIDEKGAILHDITPIWSDTRAKKEVQQFSKKVSGKDWYMTTGNGFPQECYTVFKVMWYKNNKPALFKRIYRIFGTKDFINFKMTGKIKTDHSYASGSGIYDLKRCKYSPRLIEASGLPGEFFPEIVPSTQIIGELTKEAAEQLNLPQKVKVACGGVDNSCIAVGARSIKEGRVYTSLGSSAWIALTSKEPVLDFKNKPFVFTHVIPGMFTSAVPIFSAGSSYEWVLHNICSNLISISKKEGKDPYQLMDALASKSPVGSKSLLFNPSLAGGSSLDKSPYIRGAYLGLDLGHTQSDLIRSVLEGIAMNLRLALDILRKFCKLQPEMILVGGGSKSKLWRQIFADIYNIKIAKTNIGQEVGSLGAAAVAAVGSGLWRNFSKIDDIHQVEEITIPILENVLKYEKLLNVFKLASEYQAEIGDLMYLSNPREPLS